MYEIERGKNGGGVGGKREEVEKRKREGVEKVRGMKKMETEVWKRRGGRRWV